MATSDRGRILSLIGAVAFVLGTMALGYLRIGLPPVVIVGGSGVIALVMWNRYYLKRPPTPDVILPLFLLTVAALEIHMMEEYLTGFGPAMSRLFDISWTERSFLIVFAFVGPALYALTALGLYFRVPLAGFMAWFILIGPGVAEFTHFVFPVLKPGDPPGAARNAFGDRVERPVRCGDAQLLPWHHRHLLLPRPVHRRAADDPGHLGHRANGAVAGAGAARVEDGPFHGGPARHPCPTG
jgi:hypothetical protein